MSKVTQTGVCHTSIWRDFRSLWKACELEILQWCHFYLAIKLREQFAWPKYESMSIHILFLIRTHAKLWQRWTLMILSMTRNSLFQDCNCKYPLTTDRLRMKIDKHFNGIPENYKKEGYDSQCDPRTLMNSLKCADETSFADRAASFKSLKGSLLWKRGATCTEFQLTMRHFQLFEKLLIKHGKWR